MKDTVSKTRLFLSPPHMGGNEREFVAEAFASNYIAPLGPMVDAFEKEFAAYTGIPHCVALSSGTAAMHLALRELGVGPGDEVLASTLTFIGSVTPITFFGATPVFIDSDERTWNLDLNLLAEELAGGARRGKLPKAVVPTDLYGQCCDLPRITSLCADYGIPVVSDSAEAMGAFYQSSEISGQKSEVRAQESKTSESSLPSFPSVESPSSALTSDHRPLTSDDPHSELTSDLRPLTSVSSPSALRPQPSIASAKEGLTFASSKHAGFGARAAVFSFNGNKIMTTSGGGMLASNDARLIEHARKLSQQARDPAPHYEHTEIGYNYRMSNILAAIGRGQLRVLDDRVKAKRRIFGRYQQLLGDLPGITFMPEAPLGRCNRWLTVILIDPRKFGASSDQVRLALEAENMESRPVWKPMHLQPVFRHCRARGGNVSERLFRDGLCLPSGTAMTDADLDRVARAVRKCSDLCPPVLRYLL